MQQFLRSKLMWMTLGALTLALGTVGLGASVVLPGDGPYYRLRQERILYVYDTAAREAVQQMNGYMQAIRNYYDHSFAWELDEQEDLILTSSRHQIANAYATVFPNIKTVWFPSGGQLLDPAAHASWFAMLAAHETAHLYQLNAKGPVGKTLKKVFGNALTIFPFLWPVYIHPNVLTPTFLLEGNAVMNESRANLGGRLHSGEVRALVLAQIAAGHIDPSRLINNQFRFPYGENAYAQGGYFAAHLAAKHGVHKANQFFLAQSDHYLWPLILNKTFRDHFDASYPQEIREYTRALQGLARNQQASVGSLTVEAPYVGALNHDGSRIFFLSSDGIKPPQLHVFEKNKMTANSRVADLPMGKIFWDREFPVAAASQAHDLHHVEYSLYGEGRAFDARFRGQIVNDQRAGKTAAIDAANSWLESRILVNGEFYDVGHSSPILDDDGNVYYFRQTGMERVLFKNRQALFKFSGHYAKAMEIGVDGSFFFIASTDYGSTLYQYKANEILRVLNSDRVVDARQIDEQRFLVVEVGANGHRVMMTTAERKTATPATYSYGFEPFSLQANSAIAQSPLQPERLYNSFKELRYSSLDFAAQYDRIRGLSGMLNAFFTDPLEYQAIELGFFGSQFRDQSFLVQYSFTKYLPQVYLRYVFEREFWHQFNQAERRALNQQMAFGTLLPLLRWRHWDAFAGVAAVYHITDNHSDPSAPALSAAERDRPREETYGAYSQLALQYSRNPEPRLGFYPWRSFSLEYHNKLESWPGAWRKKYNTSLIQTQYQHGFPWQFYASLSGNVAWAENHDVLVAYNQMPLTLDIRIPRLTAHESFSAKTAGSVRFELSKVFNTPLYSARIPFGLDRTAPFVVAQAIALDSDGEGHGNYAPNIFEWGYGADLQLLLFHIAPVKLRFLNAFDTRHPARSDKQVRLTFHRDF